MEYLVRALRALLKAVSTALGAMTAVAFAAAIIGLVISLVADDFPELKDAGQAIRCLIGIPAEGTRCYGDELAALELRRAEIEAERDRLARLADDYQRREDELEALNRRVESYSQFVTNRLSFGSITTGQRFESILEPEIWSEAWCYMDLNNRGALSQKLDLGGLLRGKPIKWHIVTDRQLAELGLSRAQLEKAQGACAFPTMS